MAMTREQAKGLKVGDRVTRESLNGMLQTYYVNSIVAWGARLTNCNSGYERPETIATLITDFSIEERPLTVAEWNALQVGDRVVATNAGGAEWGDGVGKIWVVDSKSNQYPIGACLLRLVREGTEPRTTLWFPVPWGFMRAPQAPPAIELKGTIKDTSIGQKVLALHVQVVGAQQRITCLNEACADRHARHGERIVELERAVHDLKRER